MKCPDKIKKITYSVAVLLAGTAIFFSCDSSIETVTGFDVNELPALTVKEFETVNSDSGRIQLVMKSPLMQRYDRNNDPYSEFPSGIEVVFYDGKTEPVASLSARYARYHENKKMWELRYDVKARNSGNELLETELLFWDENRALVYTERFVRITGPDRIISGNGFESDTRFSKWEIRNGNAIIYLEDE